ncbi:unnamed protein product [Peronospora destructor]|uniref:Uncharacterized protein n=1 Tax=Peronospora destructor TaxID=86335 RepID=A0AAV0V3E6_9STRA|nr:unnamed protein product [Peronospora destructor]
MFLAGSFTLRTAIHTFRHVHRFSSSLGFFPGTEMPFVADVVFRDPKENDILPCFRTLNEDGDVIDGAKDPRAEPRSMHANLPSNDPLEQNGQCFL